MYFFLQIYCPVLAFVVPVVALITLAILWHRARRPHIVAFAFGAISFLASISFDTFRIGLDLDDTVRVVINNSLFSLVLTSVLVGCVLSTFNPKG